MPGKKEHPPKLAEFIFRLFLRSEDAEHRLGDLNEMFEYFIKNEGYKKAFVWYWVQVITSIPKLIINEFYWGGSMLSNYFKIAFRNLYRTKLYSILNIIGLGTAIALGIVGYVNYEFSQSFDSFHKNKENIYSINYKRVEDNKFRKFSYTPMPVAPEIKNNIAGIKNVTRISVGGGTIKYGDKVFNESFYFVDKDFFEIFTFPTIHGNYDAFKDNSGIIITNELAEKYFGKENPIGKQVLLSPDGENQFVFNISGVINKLPQNSTLIFDVAVPMDKIKELRDFDPDVWTNWSRGTFIMTEDNVQPSKIEQQIQKYKQISNEANPDFQMHSFFLVPLKEMASALNDIDGSPFNNMHPAAVMAPSVIAFAVLLLACFNFINTAIAFASRRLKEIGVRKVMGSLRSQLIKQFLIENLVLSFIALVVGILLAAIFVPAYDNLWPDISLSINFSDDFGLIIFLISLLFFTAVIAGSYPAFYISKFDPVNIFKGKQKFGGTNPLIRVLLVFQFALSMTSLIGGIVLYNNGEYINNLDLGFNKEQILNIPIQNENNFNLLKSSFENNPDILSIAGSNHLVGRRWIEENIEFDGKKSRILLFEIGENYFETLDFKLIDGRSFDKDLKSDIQNTIVINETFAKLLGFDSPVGKFIKTNNTEGNRELLIIGVVKDFHYDGVWEKIQPSAISFSPQQNYRYASIKFNLHKTKEVSSFVQKKWKELFPNLPYDGFYQSDMLANASLVTDNIKKIFFYVAIMVLLTTGLGLFALVSLKIAKRMKEISIRKVLGASIANISKLISKEFLIMILLSSVLASVMSYFLVGKLLSSIWAYHADFGFVPFLLSGIIMILLAVISIGSQVLKVSNSNPVDNIREE